MQEPPGDHAATGNPANGAGSAEFNELRRLLIGQDLDQLADIVSGTLLMVPTERQIILETSDVEQRLKHLIHFLMAEIHRHGKSSSS